MSNEGGYTGPIFIVGVARSGTTLLRYMLCGNPRIYVSPESNFIPRFFRHAPTDPLTRDRALRILEEMGEYHTFWRDWREEPLDFEGFVDSLPTLTPAALIDGLYGRYARQFGASRWGDKSTIYAGWIDLFVEMFPTCQIIHIIRDPRDVTASSLDAYRGARFFYMDAYYAARMWRERISSGIAAGRRLSPEQYREIRYEDLTAEPERHVRELCDFLGESFDEAMLDPGSEALKHYHRFGIHERVKGRVTTARRGRWRTDLKPADQRLVQRLTGNLMTELGYYPEDLAGTGAHEHLRIALLRVKFEMANLARRVLRGLGIFNPSRLLLRLPRRRPVMASGDPPPPADAESGSAPRTGSEVEGSRGIRGSGQG